MITYEKLPNNKYITENDNKVIDIIDVIFNNAIKQEKKIELKQIVDILNVLQKNTKFNFSIENVLLFYASKDKIDIESKESVIKKYNIKNYSLVEHIYYEIKKNNLFI